MKRFFALAALVLGLAACQTEPEGLDVNVGGEVETTVCVSLPEATRANSAVGAFENLVSSPHYTIRYIFQVFYEGTESQAARQVIYTDSDQVSFPVRLVPGRHYNFVVWADVTTTAGKELDTIHNLTIDEAAAADIHYNTEDLKSVAIIDNSWVAMDETRDAFTGHHDTAVDGNGEKYSSASSINLVLTRPFAKLRVITTDMEQLNDLRIMPTYATVEYTKPLYPSFNAYAGVVNDETSTAPHKTHYQYTIKTDYEYDFNNDEPKVLFTDYLFAPDYDHEVNFILTVYDQHGKGTENVIKTNNFNTAIPAHRNHLTTIKGNILTDGNDITVDVSKGFVNEHDPADNPHEYAAVTNGFELVKAYYEGKKIVMLNPIVVTQADIDQYIATRSAPAIFPEINLNGFTLTFVNDSNDPLLTLPVGSSLTIEGGQIILQGTGEGAAIENNGTLTIIDTEVNSSNNGAAVVENNGDATITDSTLRNGALVNNQEGSANISGSELNDGALVNNGEANIEESTLNQGAVENNGDATITGSTLNEGSVENNGQANVNGGNVDDNAVENGEGAVVGSQSTEDLERAIRNAKKDEPNVFTLTADIEGDVVVVIQQPDVKITIDGAGHKFNGYFRVHSNSEYYTDAALTIKNLNFETSTASVNFIDALENGSERYSCNITVENCTFTATGDAVDTAVGVQIKSSKNAKVIGCIATNMHSLIQAQSCDESVLVQNCTVTGKNGVAFKQVKAATVEGTTIVAREYGIRFDGNTDNYGIVVKDNNITAAQPFIVRKMTGKNNTIALEGENTLTSTREKYNIVFTNGSDDEAYVAPTGTYTLTGADNLIVYPRDVVSSWDEFTAAVNNGKTFFLLANDIEYTDNYSLKEDVTIDLNGKSLVINNPSKMLNIGDAKNNTKPNVTIKNGNLNCMVYALSGNLTIQNVAFGGTIAYVQASQGVISTKHASLLMEDCNMKNVKKSGSTKPRSICTEGRSGGYLIFRNCDFKNSNLDRPYINPLNGNAVLEITDCALYSAASNIDLGASYVWSNLNLTGCSGGFTFTISRASTSLTEEELTIYRAIKQNNTGSKRFIFTDGEKNNL